MDIGIHGVCGIKAIAYSSVIQFWNGPGLSHVQKIDIMGREGQILGEITLFLESPDAAIPVGDLSRLIRENEPLLLEE